jgi:hypothetical protein
MERNSRVVNSSRKALSSAVKFVICKSSSNRFENYQALLLKGWEKVPQQG